MVYSHSNTVFFRGGGALNTPGDAHSQLTERCPHPLLPPPKPATSHNPPTPPPPRPQLEGGVVGGGGGGLGTKSLWTKNGPIRLSQQ